VNIANGNHQVCFKPVILLLCFLSTTNYIADFFA